MSEFTNELTLVADQTIVANELAKAEKGINKETFAELKSEMQ